MRGYHGRYLRVDLGKGEAVFLPLPEDVLRHNVGGVGLGVWLVAHETPVGVDPLAADAAIAFVLSPLVGTPLTTSAKFAVVAKSPLTGRLNDALASSHFAIAAKRAGVDAIVLKGASPVPVVLCVDGLGRELPATHLKDAGHLWGRSASETESILRRELGAEWQIAAIGRAGERRIPFATISHDGRHAGRGGLGAILGSKQVKAIAVRGDRHVEVANRAEVLRLARELSTRSLGEATSKYRELGTVANLLVLNRLDALPTRNFAASSFEEAEQLVPEALGPSRRKTRKSCAACTIGCEHIFTNRDDHGTRLEYETLYALGPLCGVSEPASVLESAELCDYYGLDTISTGGAIAFLMDCAGAGLLADDRLPSGRPLRFGDGHALLEAIKALVEGRGLGALLALGSRRAAAEIGGDAPSRAMHVKGLELPGYDPRSLHTMGLGLAVGTRGADHNRSGAYQADLSSRVDRVGGGVASAWAAIETEDRAALMDSLILCKFLRGALGDLFEEAAELLVAVTGWDVSPDELKTVASRVVNARKCFNEREGWTRAEDTLPARLLCVEDEKPESGRALSRHRLEAMINAYYGLRGWDGDGRVPPSLRVTLGLEDPAFGCLPPKAGILL